MKAYLCSVGEKTVDICKLQLERFGFEVVMLDEKETWQEKYSRFLREANENCIRVDADVIPNKHIKIFQNLKAYLAKTHLYDLYRNEIWPLGPIYYSKEALERFKGISIDDTKRPETFIWRSVPVEMTTVLSEVVGLHGFFQDRETIERAKQNKINRGQIDNYDFDFVGKIISLK